MSEQHKRHVTVSRAHLHAPAHVGERVADAVVAGMGSWKFIIIQTVIVTVWIIANGILLTRPFDIYPFVLLNLVFSTQAAYASPLILMASNRASAKDAKRDDLESQEVAEIYANHQELLELNRQQLAILKEQAVLKQQNAEILSRLPARRKA